MIIPNSKVIPQCPEMILNEMEKTFLTRTTQEKRVCFRDSKSVFLKILAVRAWIPPHCAIFEGTVQQKIMHG